MKIQKAILTATVIAAGFTSFAAFEKIDASVDFGNRTGKYIKPALHSAGYAPTFSSRAGSNTDEFLRDLNLNALRTHDWALVNPGQRVVDTHFIFPLMHLDAKDPKNYYFAPTDKILSLAQNELGLKVFYRLGTSIEHTADDSHFNILIPDDFDKYAEVCAGIVRHYTKGWANGHNWDIKYWEIWNEPDGTKACWGGYNCGLNEKELREKFIKFYVTVLKRLKSEFPEIKVGGPAIAEWYKMDYMWDLLKACKEAGVKPDFISWHMYYQNPRWSADKVGIIRKKCDELGFKNIELIINEWHYLENWNVRYQRNFMYSPSVYDRAHRGPSGFSGIDAVIYNVAQMTHWQNDGYLDQAFFYGIGEKSVWGIFDENFQLNKSYYSMKMIGEMVKKCSAIVETKSMNERVSVLGAWSKDDKEACLLVSEFRGVADEIRLKVSGIASPKKIRAYVLDEENNCRPARITFEDDVLTLHKNTKNSASFFVIMR